MTTPEFIVKHIHEIDPKWKYAAMDAEGYWHVFELKPIYKPFEMGKWDANGTWEIPGWDRSHNIIDLCPLFEFDDTHVMSDNSLINLDAHRNKKATKPKTDRIHALEIT